MTARPGGELAIYQVDAFTTVPYAGNPAGVVLDGDGLPDATMQLIAREMNLSETAFLLPPSHPEADLRVRWFTPTVEVDLCGHGTVACLHAALEAGRLEPGAYRMECLAGVLPLELERGADSRPRIRLGLPVPDLADWNIAGCRVADALGLEPEDLHPRLPAMKAATWGVVAVSGLEALGRLRPDFGQVRDLERTDGVGELIVLTTETVEDASSVNVRMLAPACGIDEDPVTGAAQGPVAAYLVAHGLVPMPGAPQAQAADAAGVAGHLRYQAEQGDSLSRPGRIEVDVALRAGRICSITIAGSAVTVVRGTIVLPLVPASRIGT